MNNVLSTDGRWTYATLIYEWNCSICGHMHVESQRMTPGMELVQYDLPKGWIVVQSALQSFITICPNHETSLTVDAAISLANGLGKHKLNAPQASPSAK